MTGAEAIALARRRGVTLRVFLEPRGRANSVDGRER
jgi:hypothetical protein